MKIKEFVSYSIIGLIAATGLITNHFTKVNEKHFEGSLLIDRSRTYSLERNFIPFNQVKPVLRDTNTNNLYESILRIGTNEYFLLNNEHGEPFLKKI